MALHITQYSEINFSKNKSPPINPLNNPVSKTLYEALVVFHELRITKNYLGTDSHV